MAQHNPFQEEQERQKRRLLEEYSWTILAQKVAEWTNETLWNILAKPAIEVFYVVLAMQAVIVTNKNQKKDA
jgi:hypothetical protein